MESLNFEQQGNVTFADVVAAMCNDIDTSTAIAQVFVEVGRDRADILEAIQMVNDQVHELWGLAEGQQGDGPDTDETATDLDTPETDTASA